jgi:hypothetical protein
MVYVNPHEQTATAGGRPSYNVGAGHSSHDRDRGGGGSGQGQQSQGDLARRNAAAKAAAKAKADAEKARISATQSFPSDRNIGGTNVPGSAGLAVLENLGSSNLEKMMSMHDPAGLSYNFMNMLSNAYPGTRNQYGEYEPHKYDPYSYQTEGGYAYQNAEMGEPGAVLVIDEITGQREWKKPILNRLGGALLESGTTGTYDDRGRFTMTDPFATSTSKMFTGIPTTLTPTNQSAIESGLDRTIRSMGGGGGGGGGWGGYGGYGGGGGGGGGGYGYATEERPPVRGNPNELWGAQNPLQQAMISIHGGRGFQQGFRRGGIVSLVE